MPLAVAVLYEPASFPAFDLARAARDTCRLVWVLGAGLPTPPELDRLLGRLGTVVDGRGRSAGELAADLRAADVEGIVVFTDAVIPLAADLAERLGLRFHSPEVARRLTDKLEQRRALAAAGVPSATSLLVEPGGAAPDAGLPAIVKPRHGAGGREVVRVDSAEELEAALARVTEDLLVEELLADADATPEHRADHAEVVSVESVVQGGVSTTYGITHRWPFAPPFRETGSFAPTDLPAAEQESLGALAAAAATALGVRDSVLHTEIKRTPDGPRIIEVNGRVGGVVPELHLLAGGVDLLQLVFRTAVGAPLPPPIPLARVAYQVVVQPPLDAVRLVEVEGLDRVAEVAGVTGARLTKPIGTALDWREGWSSMVCAVDGVADDHAAAFAARREILGRIVPHYEDRTA